MSGEPAFAFNFPAPTSAAPGAAAAVIQDGVRSLGVSLGGLQTQQRQEQALSEEAAVPSDTGNDSRVAKDSAEVGSGEQNVVKQQQQQLDGSETDEGEDYGEEGEHEQEKNEEYFDYEPSVELQFSRPDKSRSFEEVEVISGVFLQKGRVSSTEAAGLLDDDRATTNDLIPNVYEGGFKLWEGSLDLCKQLCDVFKLNAAGLALGRTEGDMEGKKVLELGCGHGLPGILCLLAGADVHFQDFNSQVLTELTMPNVAANMARLPMGRRRGSTRYFSGDWAHMGELLSSKGFGGHYDIIITSESIYNNESQWRLLECIKQVLQPPHAVVYIASKTYYFGVGGGTKTFRKLVHDDGIFEVKTLLTVEDASSGNKREVLELRFPESIVPYFL